MDDAVVHTLAVSLPRLRRLTLEKTDVSDVGVASLWPLSSTLHYLDLSRTSVRGSEESYAVLRQMSGLTHLLLAYCQVDLQLALNLPPNLEHLKLSRAIGFDNTALQCLAQNAVAHTTRPHARPRQPGLEAPPRSERGLSALDVGSPGITDEAIPALQALVQLGLRSLTLWHSKVTRRGVERLMQATGMTLDQSMASSDGTYLLAVPEGLCVS